MGRYANNGMFNVKYPTRRKIQVILQRLIAEAGAIDTGMMYDSVRIQARIPALGELEIQINAMYYFGYLNNGTKYIGAFDFCKNLTQRLDSEGITAEIYSQYTEWMAERYPILQVAQILGEKRSIIYSFLPIGGQFDYPLEFSGML